MTAKAFDKQLKIKISDNIIISNDDVSMNRSSFSNSKSKILMSSLYIKSACENLVIFTRTQNYIATIVSFSQIAVDALDKSCDGRGLIRFSVTDIKHVIFDD